MSFTKSQIFIDSADRASGETINDFFIDLSDSKHETINSIEVVSVDMVKSFYNVDDTNNKVYFVDAGVTATISTLTNQDYTEAQLATEIQTQMNADETSGETYTVSADAQTGKMTVSIGSGTFELTTTTTTNANWNMMGFDIDADKTAAGTYTGDNLIDINHPRYIDIKSRAISNLLDGNQKTTSGGKTLYSDILKRVHFNENNTFQSKISTEQNHIDRVLHLASELRLPRMDLRLEDQNGNSPPANGVNYALDIILGHKELGLGRTNQGESILDRKRTVIIK